VAALPDAPPPADLIGSVTAAARCNVDQRTFVRWCQIGRVPSYRIAGRWKVSAAELDEFIRSSRYSPPPLPV
jgi:excisionase family DNA binding protein